ncbi:GSCOCG00013482001-RA-CDS, partial [Cotesia congregata]
PLLGEACADDEDCQALNSECDDNKCVCREDYMQESINSCIPTHLGQFCREDNNCNQIKNAECYNRECACKSGYVNTDSMTCLLSLGRQCTKFSDCAPNNAICYGGICECDEYFISKSDDKCLPTLLQKKCRYLDDCRNIQFSFCAQNNLCACSFNYVAVNGTECKPLLRGECNNTSQCMVDNSICLDNRCRCKPDFVRSSHTHCIPNRFGAACKKDFDCINVKNSKCINGKCDCLKNHLFFNSTLCAALLGEVCQENG